LSVEEFLNCLWLWRGCFCRSVWMHVYWYLKLECHFCFQYSV